MRNFISKITILTFLFYFTYFNNALAFQENKTGHHNIRKPKYDIFNKPQKLATYRSFQPPIGQKPTYNKADDRNDYDLNTYDSEYGVVLSNFTSSVYDDNPPLYPNPDVIVKETKGISNILKEKKEPDPDMDLPDDSLADADLAEHNIIDSVTYVYGFNNCHGMRDEWMVLIYITSGLAVIFPISSILWLMWSESAAEFRRSSKLYPININLCCCLAACTLIYIQAAVGASSPSQCERIALLLHYTHITCAVWIVALGAAVAEFCTCDNLLPLKYNYLLAYGVPAIVVMFNYALSMEQYEIKHYCWMSIEKGMVMGFMIPAMILILINTAIIIVGLQSVNQKQNDLISAKIQDLVDQHLANWPKNEPGSSETLNNVCTPLPSRKNTDSSDTLDRDSNDEDNPYTTVTMGASNSDANSDEGREMKRISDKHVINLWKSMAKLSWKNGWNIEGNDLKAYLNLCLILEPFFAINWVMGVVAIENATHWSTPTIYLILVLSMHIYLMATICTTLPIVQKKTPTPCTEVSTEPTIVRSRTTDSIPLLDPTVQQANVTPAPVDTISTISI
ncbi:uncharacterized protein LOC123720078 [Pieris brassicae]|uniref:G-protein coupled receptors family 2 profile 2 domain-containing protein n=1 Tax=Pieris brassicae TaxID=7116 RepID=A0A9P0U1A7_PIEBR|nr:uncharacterized protein LOC123720078 [Pieris brassicae]CAH4037458.1 unnamed protein product [Pieris brassicae]